VRAVDDGDDGTSRRTERPVKAAGTLTHDALFYTDEASYRSGLLAFVREGLERDEPVLVAVPEPGLGVMRAALSPAEAARVRIADMAMRGRNPGRIIGSVLTAFVREHSGKHVRIIGEPIWAGRSTDEYPACAEHEALINVALADSPAYVLCPYDVSRLDREALTDATRTHPTLASEGERWDSPGYTDPVAVAAWFDSTLPAAPCDADVMVIGASTGTRAARRFVHDYATDRGMKPDRVSDLRTAVQELVVNTALHSGGSGLLSIWSTDTEVVCQVQDGGHISDPLAGRRPPEPSEAGHGLYTVHLLCDLVRVHRCHDGTTVRVHVGLK
jgi:anti-sigma regulatory factor (Ser/Thr protein kinase)